MKKLFIIFILSFAVVAIGQADTIRTNQNIAVDVPTTGWTEVRTPSLTPFMFYSVWSEGGTDFWKSPNSDGSNAIIITDGTKMAYSVVAPAVVDGVLLFYAQMIGSADRIVGETLTQ